MLNAVLLRTLTERYKALALETPHINISLQKISPYRRSRDSIIILKKLLVITYMIWRRSTVRAVYCYRRLINTFGEFKRTLIKYFSCVLPCLLLLLPCFLLATDHEKHYTMFYSYESPCKAGVMYRDK